MVWYPKSEQKKAIVRENHERWKASYKSWQQQCIDTDNARPKPEESIHEITRRKFDPKGAAIMKAWKDRE